MSERIKTPQRNPLLLRVTGGSTSREEGVMLWIVVIYALIASLVLLLIKWKVDKLLAPPEQGEKDA